MARVARRGVALWLGALLLAATAACVPPPLPTGTRPAESGDYRLGPPDKLLITVRPEPVISRPVVVRPDGNISFDLIGEVQVAGKTIPQVREEIYRRIQDFIVAPDVTVTLEESGSRYYYVFGEVNRVGAFPLIGKVTAVEALANAGGGTRFASLNLARLTRPMVAEGQRIFPIRYTDITEYADGITNYDLQPGDVIYVPPSASARIGYALQIIFFPLQQIIGLGGSAVVRTAAPL